MKVTPYGGNERQTYIFSMTIDVLLTGDQKSSCKQSNYKLNEDLKDPYTIIGIVDVFSLTKRWRKKPLSK